MPWKVFPEDGKYCVHELNPDGSKGSKVACHATREQAKAQMAALYANEKGFSDFGEVAVYSKPQLAHFTVLKAGDGSLRWIAHYSNNVRDNDNPPEILSAEGHRRFVYLVDKGHVPYPELWVWHEPEWRIGRADWLAVDEKGDFTFAMASGYFFKEKEEVGQALMDAGDIAMSHGMYKGSIERDQNDPTILTGWVTGELTILPREYAANKLTAYSALMDKELKDMTVKAEKIETLMKHWPGLAGDIQSILDNQTDSAMKQAKDLGLETKDKEDENVEEEDVTKDAGTTDAEDGSEEEQETKEQGEEVILLAKALVAVNERLAAVEKATSQIPEIVKQAERLAEVADRMEASEKQKEMAPLATQIADILSGSSVVGKDAAKVDGRTKLGQDSPKKAEAETGLFFEKFMNGSQ